MSSPPDLAAVLANWAAFETHLAGRFGGATLADHRGFRFRSGLTSGFTNAVLSTTAVPEAVAGLIEDVRAWFPSGIEWRWLVSPLNRPSDLATRLVAAGFQQVRILSAMTLDLASRDIPSRSAAQVAEVHTTSDLEAWLTVRNTNHALDASTRDAWLRTHPATADPAFRQFLARTRDGRPVGSMTLFFDGRTAGLYHVDVVPEARRQGVGADMTCAALDASIVAGVRHSVLTATELGMPLYRSLEYAVVGSVAVFASAD